MFVCHLLGNCSTVPNMRQPQQRQQPQQHQPHDVHHDTAAADVPVSATAVQQSGCQQPGNEQQQSNGGPVGRAAAAGDQAAQVQQPPSEEQPSFLPPAATPAPTWVPGAVIHIAGGAVEAQQLMDTLLDDGGGATATHSLVKNAPESLTAPQQRPTSPSLAVIEWYAPWAVSSQQARPLMDELAAAYPSVVCICVDVIATPDNKAFACEKVRPSSVDTC